MEITEVTHDQAMDVIAGRSNGVVVFNKSPALHVYLAGELCLDELEAVWRCMTLTHAPHITAKRYAESKEWENPPQGHVGHYGINGDVSDFILAEFDNPIDDISPGKGGRCWLQEGDYTLYQVEAIIVKLLISCPQATRLTDTLQYWEDEE